MRALLTGIVALTLAAARAGVPLAAAGGQHAAQPADSTFMITAARAGNAEIALADIADRRSTDAEVKAMAEKLKADHQAMDTDLQALGTKLKVMIPTDVTPDQKSLATKLGKLSGRAFDKAYLETTVKDHQDALALYTRAGKNADPDLKTFIDQALAVLNDHLRRAITLQKRVPTS
jgi:putative membrane protein